MATNDWEIDTQHDDVQTNSLYRWKHKDSAYQTLEISKEYDYYVVNGDGLRQVFDKLSDAVKFAKDYMKKH